MTSVNHCPVHTREIKPSVLLKILQNVKFLGRQGLAFRGHDDSESNFMQLFKLRELDNPVLSAWQKRSGDKYLSPEIQN